MGYVYIKPEPKFWTVGFFITRAQVETVLEALKLSAEDLSYSNTKFAHDAMILCEQSIKILEVEE